MTRQQAKELYAQKGGLIEISCDADCETARIGDVPLETWRRMLGSVLVDTRFAKRIVRFQIRHLETSAFKAEHDLTDEEFNSDHWQTLFAIQYPEARK